MAEAGTDLRKAAECLRRGGLVAIPTETVYGLAANALDADACLKIFEAKNRPQFDPLIVHIHTPAAVTLYADEIPKAAVQLMEKFWPGPLTLVFRKKSNIPDIVTAGLDSVALRMPSHDLTLRLLEELEFPLAAPSANPFGYVSPTTAQHVQDQLGDKVDYILDGGPCQVGVESTIVSFTGEPAILRLGGVSSGEIKNILPGITEFLQAGSNPSAPGQLNEHYAPATRLILGEIPENAERNTGALRFTDYSNLLPRENQLILSAGGDLHEAARNLFGHLRLLDKRHFKKIYAELVPESGIGRAINDRLRRAASGSFSL